ncbi:MAG TPA: TetR/AcrR family transcriptional regulator [Thermoanaerobaculia bacterium]|nr:TetR/AcrR family transcriptional regulator [Thermoanaerobaculia bacterium]
MVSTIPREQILTAATAVFAEVGYAGARVDEIAERAGVNKAMLYYHVGNKQELYRAVLRSVLEHIRRVFAGVVASTPDPVARIQALARAIARFAQESPDPPSVLFREVATGGKNLDDDLLREVAVVFDGVRALYEEGSDRGVFRKTDPFVAHFVSVGALLFLVGSKPLRARIGAMTGAGVEIEATPDELAARFADLLLEGLRVRTETSS